MNNDNNKYHFITKDIDVYFNKDIKDKNKYVVCTCAKGENDYLIEFIDHYLNLGFDKIYICDNNSDNSIEILLYDYIILEKVEIFNCRNFNSFQVQFYSMFAHEGNYEWCAFFDADEFLELGVYTNIKDFLSTIQEDVISFNWITYGTNNIRHKDTSKSVQERFIEPIRPLIMFKENVFVKSILRGGYNRFENCWFNGSHIPMCSNNIIYNIGGYYIADYQSHTHFPPRYKCGYLKHYYTKSFDEWITKSSRGWPDGTPRLSTANVLACNNNFNYSMQNYLDAFFISPDYTYNIADHWKGILEQYDVIQFTNSSKQIYALIVQLMSLMYAVSGYTFILTDNHIDDSLYTIFLEYSFETNNNIVFARNQDEIWKAYLKYHKKGDTYFIIDLK